MEISKKALLWGVIAVLFLAVIVLTFKVSSTGAASNSGELDMSDWTQNEIMNYEMHGIIPARAQQSGTPAPASGGMVGGC